MSDLKDKVLRLLDDRELRDLFDVEKVRKLVGEKALNEWADTCDCPKCQKRKAALATSVKDLKKKLARYEGVYEAILSKLGLDEAKDFENVHFTFNNEGAEGYTGAVTVDGVRHYILNVNTDGITNYHLNAFEINSPEDARKGADEAEIEIVKSIVHELQHFKQYREGRLSDAKISDDGKKYSIWEGQKIEDVSLICDRDAETHKTYQNLPWEVEAEAVSERITNELIASGRLPNRPTSRQPRVKRDILDGIDGIMKALGIEPISIAQQNDGQIVELDGKGKAKPLTAAGAQKLLDLIDSGKATFVAGTSRENGQTKSYTGDEARRTLADHLKKLVQQEKPATVH